MQTNTYLEFGERGEANAGAIFNDGPACAIEVDDDILTLVHPQLLALDHQHAVLQSRDVRGPRHPAA